jgi:hypothetical protein
MGNIAIQNNDTGDGALDQGEYEDGILTFAGAALYKRGTILARLLTVLAITPSAITGTGNGTLTAVSVTPSPNVPKVGNWVLRCITTVTNGGVWQLEDPDGAVVASGLTMTVGAGAATVFEAGGLQFTLTDGSTDFAAGAFFTLPVVASNKLVPFALAGAGGAQIPIGILSADAERAGAGDLAVRMQIRGTWNKKRLIIALDGNDTNVTAPVRDALRRVGITVVDVDQLGKIDNPQA